MIDSTILFDEASGSVEGPFAHDVLEWLDHWAEWLDLLLASGSFSPSPTCRISIMRWARNTSDLGWQELAAAALEIAQGTSEGESLSRADRTREVLRLISLHAMTERVIQGQRLLQPQQPKTPAP